MIEQVIISIKGKQLFVDQEPDELDLVTTGTLEYDPSEGYKLSYQESELTGLEGTTTVFRVQAGQVSLTREGIVNSIMVFEDGKLHVSMYETQYGSLSVGVHTRKMRVELTPSGGELELHYSLEVDHVPTGENMIHLQVRQTLKQ